jgi:Cu-Zn family superoxide dismutase
MIPALLCASVAFGQDAPKSAHADIMDVQGSKVGTATITAAADGVRILVNVEKLPPGTHGIIHNIGKCEGPAFTTAGGHLTPVAGELIFRP